MKIAPNGTQTAIAINGGLNGAVGVAVDAAGNIFNGWVVKVPARGGAQTTTIAVRCRLILTSLRDMGPSPRHILPREA